MTRNAQLSSMGFINDRMNLFISEREFARRVLGVDVLAINKDFDDIDAEFAL